MAFVPPQTAELEFRGENTIISPFARCSHLPRLTIGPCYRTSRQQFSRKTCWQSPLQFPKTGTSEEGALIHSGLGSLRLDILQLDSGGAAGLSQGIIPQWRLSGIVHPATANVLFL